MDGAMHKALEALFAKKRIVFWYCDDASLEEEWENISIPGVNKVDITSRPFAAKVEVVYDKPKEKFLLFNRGPRPDDAENFLLDLLLANAEFRTDKASLVAADLGLGSEYSDAIRETIGFFASAKRVQQLKSCMEGDGINSLKRKMLSIAAGCQGGSVEHVLMAMLKGCGSPEDIGRSEAFKTVSKCGLSKFFWEELRSAYGYASENPGLWDFVLAAFRDAADVVLNGARGCVLSTSIQAFLSDWRDNAKHVESFAKLSKAAADALDVEGGLRSVPWDSFGAADWFEAIDRRIVLKLVQGVHERTLRHEDVCKIVSERRNTHWFEAYKVIYHGAEAASAYFSGIAKTEFLPATADEAISSYAESWSKLDGYYRSFTAYAHESAKSDGMLAELAKQVDNDYVTNCLTKMNNAFQKTLEGVEVWPFDTHIRKQCNFWRECVAGEMANRKVCVIISDALRYGVARTLAERMSAIDRYSAKLEPMVGVLPSYTQLGMAALLPHETLRFAIPRDGRVLVDEKPSSSLQERNAILSAAEPKGAEAVKAEDVISWTKEEIRSHQRQNRVMYVYHNTIDAVGDDRAKERNTCEACEQAVREIEAIVRKLAGESHVSYFYVTSDHGFLYQDKDVEECDFIASPVTYDEPGTFKLSRRFFIGRSFTGRQDLMRFEERNLGMAGDSLVAIPKSAIKMRLAGAGSRFVHGGASLQEITVPLVTSAKKSREDDTAQVEIELLREGANRITTGQLAVKLYQTMAVGGKCLERTLRIGLKTVDGKTALSPVKEIVFRHESAESADRIETVLLPLNHQADMFEGEYVALVIESKVAGSEQYVPYKTEKYLLKRSIVKDFD